MLNYPASVEALDEGGYLVTFRDIPGAITEGEGYDDALQMAKDCLATILEDTASRGEPFPQASEAMSGECNISLSVHDTSKIELIKAMAAENVTKTELAKRLGLSSENAARRLVSLRHQSKIGEIERALAAVGKELVVSVRNAA